MISDCDLLVIGTSIDEHINSVLRAVPSACKIFRLNVDQYPRATALDILYRLGEKPQVTARADGAKVNVSSAKAVWFRRLGSPGLDPALSNHGHCVFARGEAEALLAGVAHLLTAAYWVSPFEATQRASSKPYQLELASACGLAVPRSLITNSPEAAATFIADNEATLYKTLLSPHVMYEGERTTLVLSSVLSDGDLSRLHEVRYAPCLFQAYIPKAYEVRITFAGGELFGAKIHSQENPLGAIDWRRAPTTALRYETIQIPVAIEGKLLELLGRLDLRFGAIDMIVRPDGEWVYLEVNPHGAWLWLEMKLGLPISASLANQLYCATKR